MAVSVAVCGVKQPVAIEGVNGSIGTTMHQRLEQHDHFVVVRLCDPDLIDRLQQRDIASQNVDLSGKRSVIQLPLITLKHQQSLLSLSFNELRRLVLKRGSDGP